MSKNPIKYPPLISTVRHRRLSLWQSAVAHIVREEALQAASNADTATLSRFIRDHRAMRAASAHANATVAGLSLHQADDIIAQQGTSREAAAYSELFYEIAEAKRVGDYEKLKMLEDLPVRKYSTADWKGWAGCEVEYLKYYTTPFATPQYRSWQDPKYGNNDINYGVIDWQIPNNAKIGILGDWGTGMPDAIALFDALVAMGPDAIIHVGDIYYSGTPTECQTNFYDVVQSVYQKYNVKIPIFTLPGNHEYYSGGVGYYQLLDNLHALQPSASCNQPASYFCLRTSDGALQFLGMDTGYNDHNPADAITGVTGPWLQNSEIAWHQDKLNNFQGTTILFSHHQLFSASAEINARPWLTAYLNDYLYETFAPYFPKVAGWIWGHEHNLAVYQNGIFGLSMGRLVGCSSYEETVAEDPYAVKYPEVPYMQGGPQLQSNDGYYDHGFAMMQLNPGQMPSITYYNYPSWGDYDVPSDPQPTALFTETFATPSVVTNQIWSTSLPGCGYNIVTTLAENGHFYAGSNGYVYALNPSTGDVMATNGLSGRGYNETRLGYYWPSSGTPILAVGTNGYALGLDQDALTTLWQTSLPDCGYNIVSIVTDQSNVYAGSNGYAYSLNPSNGSVQHQNSLSGTGSHEVRMALGNGQLFIGTNGYALALSTSDLSTQWKTSLPGCGYNITSVVTDGSYLYAGSNGYVYKLDPSNGNVLYKNSLSGMGYNEVRLAVMDGVLYVGTDGYALGLNTSDLSTQWTITLPGCGYNIVTMLAQNGQVFAGSNGYLYRLTPGTGTPLLYDNSLPGMGFHEVRVAVDNNVLIIGTNGYSLGFTATGASTDAPVPAAVAQPVS